MARDATRENEWKMCQATKNAISFYPKCDRKVEKMNGKMKRWRSNLSTSYT